ncbi:hypothetical protein Bhyg_01154 [Pseudolycoriella hygida]|uniref:Uncharacterized protein n=1 Tax=Pseudolycoriella hygida TaxID=35572 RepID=A0A9Q0N909_9DIPT|nr:hypothetical protein Bhyg_01154 [Pseudolycoriella hygida]
MTTDLFWILQQITMPQLFQTTTTEICQKNAKNIAI